MSKFFVTTPIYYVNDKPHIGHAYTTIAADVLARYHRQHGDEVLFSVGLDENSQKTVEAAEKAGQKTADYAEEMAKIWQDTWQKLGISADVFIRTTGAEHHQTVEAFMAAVDPEDIYKGVYEGWYCVACEEFKRDSDLKDGYCLLHPNRKAERLKEDNYFFKLSRYQDQLLDYFKRHHDFVQPVSRRNEVLAFIERGLEDFSISRATQDWGIPFPGDDQQVIYVWFDALVNYLTATGYPQADFDQWWPADLHIVGKDIIKFHCIYWPAMLLSAKLKLPERVFAHGFFTIDGTKISKSLGNAIDPLELVKDYGNDALRYYLLREIPFGGDGDFSRQRFETVYNADLANELGNLVQRTASMVERYFEGQIPPPPKHSHDMTAFHNALAELRFDKALAEIWTFVKGSNQFIDESKPWELAKTDTEHLTEVLGHVVADLALIAELLLPFLPTTAAKISQTLAQGRVDKSVGLLFPKRDTIEHTELKLS